MSTLMLATKLYIPPVRPRAVLRPRLIERLNEGLSLGCKLTLISAPAGSGKTTLLSEWIAALVAAPSPLAPLPQGEGKMEGVRVAWLSLDEGDSDPARFLTYLITALQTAAPGVGEGALAALQAPQPPPAEAILTAVLNDLAPLPGRLILALDDYHAIDAPAVDQALAFLLQNLPPGLHLVIASREDPPLPLARLRARGQLSELRAADLRFSQEEAAQFLSRVMGLNLSPAEVAALEARTEGWIAGLHLAALSMQGRTDTAAFIEAFSGSHRFVLDYLLEEVLQRQPAGVQAFLLRTAILGRLCGPLCDALLASSPARGQETLAWLERANLFIVPLDNERRWYRYHHLFGELLRQRLQQQLPGDIAELHTRASAWYEANGLELEALHHATAAGDVARAERLIEGRGMPLQFRGGAVPILNWLATLPAAVLDAHPVLWITYASALLMIGQVVGVADKADAAELAMQNAAPDERTRDLIGRIASIRVTVAVTQHRPEEILAQAQRALEHLNPANVPVRASITWAVGYARHLRGERVAARLAYIEALAICESIGHRLIAMMAAIGLAAMALGDNQLHQAEQTYRRALELAGDPPPPPACDAYLGLAQLCYEWNDLDRAQEHAQQAASLARQIDTTDRWVSCQLFLARLSLTRGDAADAAARLAAAEQATAEHSFTRQLPPIASVQTLLNLQRGDLAAAGRAARAHSLPLEQAKVLLAQGDAAGALTILAAYRQEVEARGWADQRLQAMILQAVAWQAHGERDKALHLLVEALALAEPEGFVRAFVDEGAPMAQLLVQAAARGIAPTYSTRLLAAFAAEPPPQAVGARSQPLIEPLSERELEVLRLIAEGLSNQEIGARLFLALDTVKGHNRRIFDKLQVQRRTEAVARARALGLV